jgi:DNA-directed RNA polymerase specialized sigma24 family protein
MDASYQQTVDTNQLVVGYALGYQQTYDPRYIAGMHELLLPVTKQTAYSVVRSAGLSEDLVDDMTQDAYLRLPDAAISYNWERTPVFVSYWRTTLRNHLISKYSKQWRLSQIPDELDHSYLDDPVDKVIWDERSAFHRAHIERIRSLFLARIERFEGSNEKYKPLARAVLVERILCLPEEQTLQRHLAVRFGVHPIIVSNWENWMRKIILSEY